MSAFEASLHDNRDVSRLNGVRDVFPVLYLSETTANRVPHHQAVKWLFFSVLAFSTASSSLMAHAIELGKAPDDLGESCNLRH